MAIVEIRGWEVGFNKVKCTKTVRAAIGLGLAEGKAVTDAVLRGEAQRIVIPDDLAAQRLVDELTQLGAIASVVETSDRA